MLTVRKISWKKDKLRVIMLVSVVIMLSILVAIAISGNINSLWSLKSPVFWFYWGSVAASWITYIGIDIGDEAKKESRVAKIEKLLKLEAFAEEHPDRPRVAWEIASTKIEIYIDNNVSQIRSIYRITTKAMIGGFLVIIFAAVATLFDSSKLQASIVVMVSGAVVSAISGTFFFVYKSTMAQAKDYLPILERINAVGMAIQILETLGDKRSESKDEATAEIAKQILSMHSPKTAASRTKPPKKKVTGA